PHDGARQRCKTRPLLAARIFPSGEKATESNAAPRPSRVKSPSWLSTSQSWMASLPVLPVARRLTSGEKATPHTTLAKPPNAATFLGPTVSHSVTSFELDPQSERTKSLLSGENEAATYQRRFRFFSRPLFNSVSNVGNLASGLRIEVKYQFPFGENAPV